MNHPRRLVPPALGLLLVGAFAASCAAAGPGASAGAGRAVKVGAGSLAAELPPGAKEPTAEIFKADTFRGPVPTTDWWSSLAWVKFSEPQYAHPLAVQAEPAGLRVCYPGPSITANRVAIMGGMTRTGDLVLGHTASDRFPDARLADASDWFVTALFADGAAALRVSYGHGSPFVYALYAGGDPRVTFPEAPQVWAGGADGPVLGVTVRGRHYGLFGPTGASWAGLGGAVLTCRSAGKPYFSLAVLPDATPEALDLFRPYAYAHVTGTRVDWSFDEKQSEVTTRFTVATRVHEGRAAGTLFALYPHQWRHTSAEVMDLGYASVRGPMRLVRGESFTTQMTYPGVLPALPALPDAGAADKDRLRRYIEEEARASVPPMKDTYWDGKWMGKVATLAPLAEQAGAAEAADVFRGHLKRRLESWFTAAEAGGTLKKAGLFYYNRPWGTLIGYPASYGSDTQLNDHHFHYGYFLKAAAEIARRDRPWAADRQWGAMVRLLVRDIAGPDRKDPQFAFLRCFDPYAGHSWASGNAKFYDGNNQESSSEAMNAWTALILWGQATADRPLRDLGIWLYTTEMEAINAYWFDVRAENRPASYTPAVVTMVWGGKGCNETWFSGNPEIVHGINWLPIHGGSLYLGLYPEYVRRNYDALVAENGGTNWDAWADLVLMVRALDDPQDALRQLGARPEPFPVEAGNSRANLYHWIHTLAALGRPDRTVTADYPLFAVFNDGRNRTYAVYAMAGHPPAVTFSDGTTLPLGGEGFALKRLAAQETK